MAEQLIEFKKDVDKLIEKEVKKDEAIFQVSAASTLLIPNRSVLKATITARIGKKTRSNVA